MEKAMREAKLHTNWIDPDEAHERRMRDFCHSLYDNVEWRADFEPFAKRIAAEGARISLGMTLLKLTVPGVPDIYQGDEAEYLALVDPDNRRPVDWNELQRSLASGSDAKQELVRRVLAVRRRVRWLHAGRGRRRRGCVPTRPELARRRAATSDSGQGAAIRLALVGSARRVSGWALPERFMIRQFVRRDESKR